MGIALPNFLKSFQEESKKYLKKGLAREIIFSGGTYQIQVIDPETQNEEWAFIQFDSQNRVKDSFCSCNKNEEEHACLHQAIGFLYIFGKDSTPLHSRFITSLWECICRQLSYQVGLSPKVFQNPSSGEFLCMDSEGKKIVELKGLTLRGADKLHKILCEKQKETEETSIKFSNLSEEELSLWRKGLPSRKLSYELSHWSELAKWWMLMQERGIPYKMHFTESNSQIPNSVLITFPDLSIDYHFSKEFLAEIIPTLAKVDSPLKVYEFSKWRIKEIRYDKINRVFQLFKLDSPVEAVPRTIEGDGSKIDLGEWNYVPHDGFYAKQQQQLSFSALEQPETALNRYLPLLKEMLIGDAIYETTIPLSTHIFFDSQWTLHLNAYLFFPGDLLEETSCLFDSWAYLNGKGFYKIEDHYFESINSTIRADQVEAFINQHRTWLNTQPGFNTHISPIRTDLSYTMLSNHSLQFSRNLTTSTLQKTHCHEFGQWVYLESHGFFSKLELNTQIPLGITIPPERVVDFIRKNKGELHFVKNFFSEKCPVKSSGLSITLKKNQTIEISPHYEFIEEYVKHRILFFGEYVFVEGEGFYELPAALQLPEKYLNPVLIKGDEALSSFLDFELPSLQPLVKYLEPSILKPASHQLVATEFKRSDKGYTIELDYQTELGTVPLSSIWDSLRKNRRLFFSAAGRIDLHSAQFQWLSYFKKNSLDQNSNQLTLSTLELFRLNALEPIQLEPLAENAKNKPLQLLKELTELQMPEMPDITGLQSQLRNYQQLGVRWLWFLYHYGLSGLLCDDMGLGKTHQAMALLMAIVNAHAKKGNNKKVRFLIICPTSVIFHWQEKLQLYLPSLKVWTFHGAKRKLELFADEMDILLTSYGIWRNEQERLRTLSFEVAIFDELQLAKNQSSNIHRSLLEADAKMRVGLTGTPIENRLKELKALFDIVLPNYMPIDTLFNEQFIKPIEKEGNKERQGTLSRLANPFILRRKKEDVLTDLPEKIEEISRCELLLDQKRLYQKVLTQSREMILAELEDENAPIPYLHIFALFSHLKQICNHPAAYLRKPEEYMQHHSGKWELFKELLEEARASNQKVVVFSQYLMMLDIIQLYLQKHNIEYAGIRGSTTNRGVQLQRFNKDAQCQVFVASLQAAGLGVDLTAGSVVIHYDRWWNAARENQATDRVHRIGQTRGVQVFKLMTKETIEEHIHLMIDRKGKLMEEMIGVDDHQTIKTFNRAEITHLLHSLSAAK